MKIRRITLKCNLLNLFSFRNYYRWGAIPLISVVISSLPKKSKRHSLLQQITGFFGIQQVQSIWQQETEEDENKRGENIQKRASTRNTKQRAQAPSSTSYSHSNKLQQQRLKYQYNIINYHHLKCLHITNWKLIVRSVPRWKQNIKYPISTSKRKCEQCRNPRAGSVQTCGV